MAGTSKVVGSILGARPAGVGVHIALLGPVVLLRIVGIGGMVWRDVGAILRGMTFYRMAAAGAVRVRAMAGTVPSPAFRCGDAAHE